jgi:hypothetical protein
MKTFFAFVVILSLIFSSAFAEPLTLSNETGNSNGSTAGPGDGAIPIPTDAEPNDEK